MSGHLDNPVKGPKYACGTPTFPDLFVLNDVEGSVAGTPYALQVTVNNFTGHGKQTGNSLISLTKVGDDPSHGYLSVYDATVVMSSKTGGTFEGDVQQGLDSGAPKVHVRGSFHC